MSEHTGAQIKDARTAAGMTQKELAESVDGLNAKMVSEAERGLRELPDEQLAAIAEVTGSESLLVGVAEGESPEAPAEDPAVPVGGEEDILNLFNAADPAVKEAALSVLKGDTPQTKGLLDSVLPMVVEMLGGDKSGNPLVTIMGFLATKEGKAFLGALQGVLGSVAGAFGSAISDANQDGQKTPGSLLFFTFCYAVAIYVLLLSFYFWLIRTDIKPEK